jgi:hypothetical protein
VCPLSPVCSPILNPTSSRATCLPDVSNYNQRPPRNGDALRTIAESKALYWEWVSYREGGASWAESLLRKYQDARRGGTLEIFMNNLLIWHGEGKAIMARSHDISSRPLPPSDWEVRDLWWQTFELVMSLQEGISAMEMVIAIHRVSSLGI